MDKSEPLLEFSGHAQHDLETIWQYIAERELSSADSLLDELYLACKLLAINPLAGRSRHDLIVDLRFLPHKNYNIFYFPTENGVEIYRVLHSSRDMVQIFEQTIDEPE